VRLSCSALLGLPSARFRLKGLYPGYPDFRLRTVSSACWPCLLLQPFATTMALTPAARHLGLQVSPLISRILPNVAPPTTWVARMSFYLPKQRIRCVSGFAFSQPARRHYPAESSSLYCAPPVRLQLLPTPPRGDAVTFGYRALAYPDTDSHRAVCAPSRAHWELRPRSEGIKPTSAPPWSSAPPSLRPGSQSPARPGLRRRRARRRGASPRHAGCRPAPGTSTSRFAMPAAPAPIA